MASTSPSASPTPARRSNLTFAGRQAHHINQGRRRRGGRAHLGHPVCEGTDARGRVGRGSQHHRRSRART
jgi:hypothetical protein